MDIEAAREAGRSALDDALRLELDLGDTFPSAWTLADRLRADPPHHAVNHPWCLLQSGAYGGLALHYGRDTSTAAEKAPLLAALHHWRWTRSVYVVNPALWVEVTDQPLLLGGLGDLQLPEWCAFFTVAGTDTRWWAHPLFDDHWQIPVLNVVSTGVPGSGTPPASTLIPLDQVPLTEETLVRAFRARIGATNGVPSSERGTSAERQLQEKVTEFARGLAHLVTLVAYIARPDADITNADHPGQRPRKSPGPLPIEERRIWLVGYSQSYD
jgi:hypothetical protein